MSRSPASRLRQAGRGVATLGPTGTVWHVFADSSKGELPAGSNLTGSAGSADFRTVGRLGTVRIRIGLGTIEVEHADTPHLKSGAGDITVDHATGAAELTAG